VGEPGRREMESKFPGGRLLVRNSMPHYATSPQKTLPMRALATLIVLCLSACAVPTKQDVAQQWVGRNITEAVSEFGPPQFVTPLPGGITIYTWEQQYGSSTAISRATCRKGLHVNAQGQIVDASQLSESLLCK